jgi:heme-degrading monooxygenase HmoA
MIKRIVKLEFLEGNESAFLEIFEEVQLEIKKFPGCQSLELLQGTENGNVFFTVSKWESKEALESYRNSPLFTETWEKTKILFARKAEAWTTTLIAELA